MWSFLYIQIHLTHRWHIHLQPLVKVQIRHLLNKRKKRRKQKLFSKFENQMSLSKKILKSKRANKNLTFLFLTLKPKALFEVQRNLQQINKSWFRKPWKESIKTWKDFQKDTKRNWKMMLVKQCQAQLKLTNDQSMFAALNLLKYSAKEALEMFTLSKEF